MSEKLFKKQIMDKLFKDKNTEKENLFYALEANAKKKYKNNPEKLKEVVSALKREVLHGNG